MAEPVRVVSFGGGVRTVALVSLDAEGRVPAAAEVTSAMPACTHVPPCLQCLMAEQIAGAPTFDLHATCRARVARLAGLLREHEWEGYVGGVAACLACGRKRRDGHAPDCELGTALHPDGS